jgi:teichuronic acid biosynthesis glycosyltransferase TuaH
VTTLMEPSAAAKAGAGAWHGIIVLCAANSWDDVKLADRHMAERLTAHAPVLYVDPPVSRLTRFNNPAVAASLAGDRLRLIGPRLARYTPLVLPKPRHPLMRATSSLLVRRQLRGAIARLGGDVGAVVSTWLFIDAYGVAGDVPHVYWWQDDPVGAAALWGMSADRLARGENALARASDLVAAVNEEVSDRWQARGFPSAFLPNGCDAPFFAGVDDAADPPDVDLPGPIAGFVGHLNSRTDLALLEAVADAGTSLLLIGPKDPGFEPERFDRLSTRPNVAHVGQRPFEDLPSYLKAIDVGLVPYADTPFNRGSFPMKTLEYLSAGRAVVATPLPAVRWLDTGLVTLAGTPQEFAAAVAREAARDRDEALVAERQAFAARHSWAERASQLAGLLESLRD